MKCGACARSPQGLVVKWLNQSGLGCCGSGNSLRNARSNSFKERYHSSKLMNRIWPGGSFKAERKEGKREKGGSVGHVFHRWVCEKWESGLVDGGGDKTPARRVKVLRKVLLRKDWFRSSRRLFFWGEGHFWEVCVSKRLWPSQQTSLPSW